MPAKPVAKLNASTVAPAAAVGSAKKAPNAAVSSAKKAPVAVVSSVKKTPVAVVSSVKKAEERPVARIVKKDAEKPAVEQKAAWNPPTSSTSVSIPTSVYFREVQFIDGSEGSEGSDGSDGADGSDGSNGSDCSDDSDNGVAMVINAGMKGIQNGVAKMAVDEEQAGPQVTPNKTPKSKNKNKNKNKNKTPESVKSEKMGVIVTPDKMGRCVSRFVFTFYSIFSHSHTRTHYRSGQRQVSLTINGADNQPATVNLQGETHLINLTKMISDFERSVQMKDPTPELRDRLTFLKSLAYNVSWLDQYGWNSVFVSTAELSNHLSIDKIPESEKVSKKKDENKEVALMSKHTIDLLTGAGLDKKADVETVLKNLPFMSPDEFYEMCKGFTLTLNFGNFYTQMERDNTKKISKQEYYETGKSLFGIHKKVSQMLYLSAFLLGKQADKYLSSTGGSYKEGSDFAIYCQEVFGKSTKTVKDRYIRFYKFLAKNNKFLLCTEHSFTDMTKNIKTYQTALAKSSSLRLEFRSFTLDPTLM